MSHVFISYAKEDGKVARHIAEELKRNGMGVFYFEDPDRQGGIIVRKLADEIKKTNIFLVLLSPSYLSSEWCRVEFEVGFHFEREARSKSKDFTIYILKVGLVEPTSTVFERIYAWIDLTGVGRDQKLREFLKSLLNTGGKEEVMSTMPKKDMLAATDWLPFQNREKEIQQLITNLENPAGSHFHMIISPPQMGKTWLLDQLRLELLEQNDRWLFQAVDLLEPESLDARGNPIELLERFGFKFSDNNIEMDELTIVAARQISISKRHWLLLLDSAELLSDEVASKLRGFLSKTKRKLEESGVNTRLAIIVASRVEINAFKGLFPRPAFSMLVLTPFTENVISDAIKDVAEKEGATRIDYWTLAGRLSRITEGLPALLTKYLEWMREKGFIFKSEEIGHSSDKLVGEYVEDVLLSAKILIPNWSDPNTQENARKFWADLVLRTSAFRVVSRSHIRFLEQEGFITKLPSSGDSSPDLLDAYGKLSIVVPTLAIWHRVDPAIRRLLFRYRYQSDQEEAQIHEQMEKLYEDWISKVSGTDVLQFLVERFWHRVEYVRLQKRIRGFDRADEHLEKFLVELCNEENLKPDGFTYPDLLELMGRLISDDAELLTSLEEIGDGFSERIQQCLKELKGGTQ